MGDVGLALVIGVVQVGGTYLASRHQAGRESFDVVAGALLAAGPAALVVRRRFPVPVYVAAFATTLTYVALGYPRGPIFFGVIVAFVTTVLRGHRAVSWRLLALGYVSFLFADTLFLDEPGPGWIPALGLAAWLIVLAGAGEGVRVSASGARRRCGPGRRSPGGGRARSACGSPGSCTTCWPTTSP